MKKKGVVVIDVGTSKVHANIIDIADGTLLKNDVALYPWIQKCKNQTEIKSDDIWEAAQNVLEKILGETKNLEIIGLSFSWFGGNLVTMDESGNEVFPLIVSFDSRAQEEACELQSIISAERGITIGRGGLTSESIPAKILWLQRKFPERFKRIRYIGSIEQFFYKKMGLNFCAERSLAQTLQYREPDGSLMQDIMEASGLPAKLLDYPNVEGDAVLTYLEFFGRVKLPGKLPVLYGGHDCVLSQLGSGVLPEGGNLLGDVAGTFDLMGFFKMLHKEEIPEKEMVNTPITNVYSYMEGGPSGAILSQTVETIWGRCSGSFLSEMFAKSCFDGKHGGLWRLSDWQELKRHPDILRNYSEQQVFESIVEEITFGLRDSYQKLVAKNGRAFEAVRVGGGAAKSKKWLQLKADIIGVSFELMENMEVSSMGAAAIAAVVLGYYPDYRSALRCMVHVGERYEPACNDVYEELYNMWKTKSADGVIL